MQLRYLRHRVYQSLVRPVSLRARKRRSRVFSRLMGLQSGLSVIDLGGQPGVWRDVEPVLDVVILNLPGAAKPADPSHHHYKFVDGDACAVDAFADRSFDLVFSNSVIEHVGDEDKQRAFAREVRRLGRSYWVQTPSIWFPIEAHTGMPFWWFYPEPLRQYFFRGWKAKLPAWTESMEETRVLKKQLLQSLFPEASIYVETYFGIPKSYTAWYRGT